MGTTIQFQMMPVLGNLHRELGLDLINWGWLDHHAPQKPRHHFLYGEAAHKTLFNRYDRVVHSLMEEGEPWWLD